MTAGVRAALALAALAMPMVTLGCGRSKPLGMDGTAFVAGRDFGRKYCGPCHSKGRTHALGGRAHQAFTMDTYAEWLENRGTIIGVLDKWHPDGKIMPPPEAPLQPADDERRVVLDWMKRGAPNTPNGR